MFRNKLQLAFGTFASVATVGMFKIAADDRKKEYEEFKRKYRMKNLLQI